MSERATSVGLHEVQQIKVGIFSLQEGSVLEMNLGQAGLAFGISEQRFLSMARKGKSLVIKPTENCVRISLRESAGIEQRNLWQEMVDSFIRSRNEVRQTKADYVRLYTQIQRGLPEDLEDDIGLFHLTLYALWEQLPEGMQRTLSSMSPEKVRNTGIAGSME